MVQLVPFPHAGGRWTKLCYHERHKRRLADMSWASPAALSSQPPTKIGRPKSPNNGRNPNLWVSAAGEAQIPLLSESLNGALFLLRILLPELLWGESPSPDPFPPLQVETGTWKIKNEAWRAEKDSRKRGKYCILPVGGLDSTGTKHTVWVAAQMTKIVC